MQNSKQRDKRRDDKPFRRVLTMMRWLESLPLHRRDAVNLDGLINYCESIGGEPQELVLALLQHGRVCREIIEVEERMARPESIHEGSRTLANARRHRRRPPSGQTRLL